MQSSVVAVLDFREKQKSSLTTNKNFSSLLFSLHLASISCFVLGSHPVVLGWRFLAGGLLSVVQRIEPEPSLCISFTYSTEQSSLDYPLEKPQVAEYLFLSLSTSMTWVS